MFIKHHLFQIHEKIGGENRNMYNEFTLFPKFIFLRMNTKVVFSEIFQILYIQYLHYQAKYLIKNVMLSEVLETYCSSLHHKC